MEARASSLRADDPDSADEDERGSDALHRGSRSHHRRSRSRSPSSPVPPTLRSPQGSSSKPDRPKLSFGISTILSDEEPSTVNTSGRLAPSARVSSAMAPLEIVFGIPFHGLCAAAAAATSDARYLGYYAHASSVGVPTSGLQLFKPEMYPFLPGLIKMAPQTTCNIAGSATAAAADCHVTGHPVSGLTSAIFPWMQERKDRLSGINAYYVRLVCWSRC